jgi:hypothetical protein
MRGDDGLGRPRRRLVAGRLLSDPGEKIPDHRAGPAG